MRIKNLTQLSAIMALSALSFSANAEIVKEKFHGLTVNANLEMADGSDFNGPTVLLTHGTLTHKGRSTYTQLQNNLKAQGINSLAINLSLGLDDRDGEYDCATPHTHKHTDSLNEIGFWLDWLNAKGANNVTLMGHSRGGNQTAWFAHDFDSEKFKKVILIAPATGHQQSAEEYKEKYGTAIDSLLTQANKMIAAGKGKEFIENIGFIYCKDAKVTAEALVDYYTVKPEFDTPTLLASAKKPTLVVMGSADTVVADLPEKIQSLVDSGKISAVTLDDADHFFLDFANEDLAFHSLEFINK